MIQKPKEKLPYLDNLSRPSLEKGIASFDLPLARYVQKYKNSSVLFSRSFRTSNFTTSDSKLYLTQEELNQLRCGVAAFRPGRRIDSLVSRNFSGIRYFDSTLVYTQKAHDPIFERIQERYLSSKNYVSDLLSGSARAVSVVHMWNVSIVASLIFGMFLMTVMYRYLGQGASAGSKEAAGDVQGQAQVLGAEEEKRNKEIEEQVAQQILEEHAKIREEAEKNSFQGKIKEMTKGYPIEEMAPDIARQDKIVAAFLIGIAKKESNWGKRVPVLDGKDCYNYWGFRAKRDKMGTGGHTCFNSPSDAVASVSKRIKAIIEKEKIKTPEGMVTVWKCGYDCSWDSKSAVKKWVSDVDGYFDDVNELKKN